MKGIDRNKYQILKLAFELESIGTIADLSAGLAFEGSLEKHLELLKIELGEEKVLEIMEKATRYMNGIMRK